MRFIVKMCIPIMFLVVKYPDLFISIIQTHTLSISSPDPTDAAIKDLAFL